MQTHSPCWKISMWIACKCKYDTYDSHLSFRLIFCVKFHKLEGALLPKHKFEEMYPSTEYFTVYIHYKKIHENLHAVLLSYNNFTRVYHWSIISRIASMKLELPQYQPSDLYTHHDDVIKWKHFPHYWPFVRGIHRSPVNFLHKSQWRGALMFFLFASE